MSDTTSFLGGAALAGLAALVVMRGGVTIGSPSPSISQLPQLPQLSLGTTTNPATSQVALPPAPSPAPVAAAARSDYESAKLQVTVEDLKARLEQQQAQLRSQQAVIDTLTAQLRTASLPAQQPQPQPVAALPQSAPTPSAADQATNSVIAGLPWALGGMMLTFGGGIALVGMFALLSRQNRPSRTIEVIHDDYPTYLPTAPMAARRRVQVLPPRRVIKRVEAEED